MAYYTGQCSSYQHLADILVEKCQQHGWDWQDNILSKDDLFIKIEVKENYLTPYDEYGIGIIITGGMGRNGANLINPSPVQSRLGQTSRYTHQPFPAHYHAFIFANEVYLIMKFDINKFYYLAFGQSKLLKNAQCNGLWFSAISLMRVGRSNENTENIEMSANNGGGLYGTSTAPFWTTQDFSDNSRLNYSICHGLDGELWSYHRKKAYCHFMPLINRLPTAHFADSPLLPYNIYLERPENKLSLVAQFENARFVRIDNYEPEEIITLGHERWIIFPFLQKNVKQRDGGWVSHTGTFGWAIRYEG